jgi:hypothetical protein
MHHPRKPRDRSRPHSFSFVPRFHVANRSVVVTAVPRPHFSSFGAIGRMFPNGEPTPISVSDEQYVELTSEPAISFLKVEDAAAYRKAQQAREDAEAAAAKAAADAAK